MHRVVAVQKHLMATCVSAEEGRDSQTSSHPTASREHTPDKENDVCIVSATRTPIGSFGGKLSTFTACQLGSIAIASALERANVPPHLVDEVYMGNVLSAQLGQAPASQAAFAASIPTSVPCTTVNKVCASGMKGLLCLSFLSLLFALR